jgi:threonine dehydrogenase-like Zn-dependent dehydrogenase
MKAVVLQGKNQLAIKDVPEPALQRESDVLVRVTTAAICGSDIHIKHGLVPGIGPGTIMGHEFVGVIERAGNAVTRFKRGDRVSAPAAVWCGTCAFCRRGDVQYCENGGVWGGGEFLGRGLSGVQTTYVRVPYADVCLAPIPDSVPDDQAVFVGDVFSTGYYAAREGRILTGDTVAVFGCGPIGLAALVSAWQFGAGMVIGVDMFPNRLAVARRYGALTIDAREGSVAERVREAAGGEGVDAAIEAVGTKETFECSWRSVRKGGTVSAVGLFFEPVTFPIHELVTRGLRLSMGLGNLGFMNRLMSMLAAGRVDLSPLVTHTFSLEDALDAYDLVENRKESCIKVLLKP